LMTRSIFDVLLDSILIVDAMLEQWRTRNATKQQIQVQAMEYSA